LKTPNRLWEVESQAQTRDPSYACDGVLLCRSGWQAPKDTGLWEYSTKVAEAIQQQMTATQQEYWQGENGYFSQVGLGLGVVLFGFLSARRPL
jgi:hypothetical protein